MWVMTRGAFATPTHWDPATGVQAHNFFATLSCLFAGFWHSTALPSQVQCVPMLSLPSVLMFSTGFNMSALHLA